MFAHIVVGTDGSPGADEAVKAAGAMAAIPPHGTVHVVTAYDPLTGQDLRRLESELPSEFDDQLSSDLLARPALEGAAGILRARGLKFTTQEVNGSPAEAILARAKHVGADVIVVGSRGEGAIDRLRHGSTSTKVIHDAPCSVLVVKHNASVE